VVFRTEEGSSTVCASMNKNIVKGTNTSARAGASSYGKIKKPPAYLHSRLISRCHIPSHDPVPLMKSAGVRVPQTSSPCRHCRDVRFSGVDMVRLEQEQDATMICSFLLSCCDPGPHCPGAWLMVVLVYIWQAMAGHMEVLQPSAQ